MTMSTQVSTLTPEQIELLKSAYIPEEQWEHCHIAENSIFTPIYDQLGNLVNSGKEVYDKWIYDKENPPTPPKTTEEKLADVTKELAFTKVENTQLKQQVSSLTLESAKSIIEMNSLKQQNSQLTLTLAQLQNQVNSLIQPQA